MDHMTIKSLPLLNNYGNIESIQHKKTTKWLPPGASYLSQLAKEYSLMGLCDSFYA